LKERKLFPGGGYLTGCGAPVSKLAVRADGVIVPCNLLSHMELGRINKDDLKEVWDNSLVMQRFIQRREIPLENFEYCKGCKYQPYCTGNCPALAYTLTGHEDRPSPDACLKSFLEEGGKLPDKELFECKQ